MLAISSLGCCGTHMASMRQPPEGGGIVGRPPPGAEARRADLESQLTLFAEESGLDSAALDELTGEVLSAVASVLSESDGTTDPSEAILEAISNTLQENGLDGEAFVDQMEALHESRNAGSVGGMTGLASSAMGQSFGFSAYLSNMNNSLLDSLSLFEAEA